MNHIYRIVFNSRLGLWQAVCEIARNSGGGSGVVKAGNAWVLSALTVALLGAVLAPGRAQAGGDGGEGGSYTGTGKTLGQAGTLGGAGGNGGAGVNDGSPGSNTDAGGASGHNGVGDYGGGGGGATWYYLAPGGNDSHQRNSTLTGMKGGIGGDYTGATQSAKGGGGGGGAALVALESTVYNAGNYIGGAGGGNAGLTYSGGGGGAGIVAVRSLVDVRSTGTVTGGAGGASQVTISPHIGKGGTGEGGALGGNGNGQGAQGGAGIVGNDLELIVAGTVSGGAGGTGQPQAAAVLFAGGSNNLLTLQTGAQFNGGIVVAGLSTSTTQATIRNAVSNTDVLTSSLSVAIGSTATLSGAQSPLSVSGVISGAGTLVVAGPSEVRLLGTNTFTGAVNLDTNSKLILGNNSTEGSLDNASGISTALNSWLIVSRTNAVSLNTAITGAGRVSQTGVGTTTLSNAGNTYSGGTQVSEGTLIASTSNALGTGAVSVTGTLSTPSTSARMSTLRVNSGVTLNTGNAITLANNGTLDNRGAIKSLVSSNASAGAITVSNTGTTSQLASIDGGNAGAVSLGNGGTVSNTGNAVIEGSSTPVGVSIQGGVGKVDNLHGATIRGSTSAVSLGAAGSQLNNSDGALITGLSGNGVTLGADAGVNNLRGGVIVGTSVGIALSSGGTVLNDGWGSSPGGSRVASTIRGGAGGVLASNAAATVNNKNGAVIGGGLGAGVQLLQGGSVVNDGVDTQSGTASRISGGFAGVSIDGAPGTVTNSNGAAIQSGLLGLGVGLSSGGSVSNSGNATITGGLVGVNLAKGGSVTNEAGSTITGTVASVQAARGGSATILTNHGKLNGSVTLDDQAANQVTLGTGSNITGDLNMGAQVASSLTLTGAAVGGASPLYSTAVTGTTTFAGALTKNGSSTWVLDRDLSAAKTMIDGGTLQLGNGQAVGSVGSGDIINNSTLLINRSDTLALGQVISGMGSLQQGGTGTTLLTGTNTYTGGTTVNSGTLLVGNTTQGGSVAGNVQVNAGATLGGSGSIGGNVAVADGATLSPGNSPGTLTVGGDLMLTAAAGSLAGSSTVFQLGQAGVAGAASNDLINVGGSVALGGKLDATVSSAGWYRLFNYGTRGAGSVTGSFDNTVLQSNSSSFVAGNAVSSVLTTVPNQVNLAVVGQNQALQLWNGAHGNTWDANTVNWTNDAPTSGMTGGWKGSVAVFGTDTAATPATITVSGEQIFDTLQFNASGYTVAAGSSSDRLRISPASGGTNPATGIINVDPGVGAEISAGIANGTANRLTKVGRGTLTLSGQNSYTGGTSVINGTLNAASNSALGIGSVTVDGSTSALNVNRGVSLSNAVVLNNEATLNNSGTLTATGMTVSSHSGPVTVNNLSGAVINPGAGGTAIQLQGGGSILNAGSIGHVAANVGVSLLAGGSIDNQAGSTIVSNQAGGHSVLATGSNAVSLRNAGNLIGDVQLSPSAANSVTLLTGGSLLGNLDIGSNVGSTVTLDGAGNQTYSSAVTGDTAFTGALTKTGSGTWTLDKNLGSGFAAPAVTIADGTLALAGAGSLGGSASLNLTDHTARFDISAATAGPAVTALLGVAGSQIHLGANQLSFGDNSDQTFAGSIDGTGGITKTGAGTVALTGNNSYSGTTTIAQGTLQVGAGGTTGALGTGVVTNNGVLSINRSDAVTLAQNISGSGALEHSGTGTTMLTGTNSYTGGTVVASGTLQAGSVGALVQNTSYYLNQGATLDLNNHALQTSMLMGNGNVLLGSADLTVSNAAGQTDSFGGQIAGTGHLVKQGAGTLTLNGASSFSGGVNLKQGRINLGNALGLGSGMLSMDDGTTIGLNANGMTIANNLLMTGHNDPIIDTGANNATWAGAISGAGFLTKQGTGALTMTSTGNNYTGATEVAQGTLQAGATNTFSSISVHHVAAGATLDLAGYNQTLASLNNSGTVKLSSHSSATPGTVLKVTGPYVGNGGTLGISTVLAADGSATDKLLLSGANAVASGTTAIQVTHAGGLGAQTMGTGIQVVGTENGGSLQANSFTLAGEHVDAGAYEYRLFQTAQGATLQSDRNTQLAYRSEVPLLSALPAQLRQADMAMLGDVHKRMGDDNVQSHNGTGNASASTDLGQNRRAWGRILRTDPTIHQQGTVSPESSGHMTGFQAGLDLYANHRIKAGIYVGQLDGDMRTTGFAGGIHSKSVGFNTLRSRYLGVYGNWKDASGLYADAVLQGADYRSQLHTAENTGATAATTKGSGWLASLEVGKPWALNSHWLIEPQAQLIYRKISLDDTALSMATVKNRADDDWTLRLGARIKGSFTTSAGVLQPYGRINVYKASNTTDIASFVVPAATTDVKAKGGYTATELAVGTSLQLSKSTSLYGELGKLWANGGDSRVKSGVQASVGLKVLW